MIQANELRIGNLIYSSDGIVVTADARTIFDIWDVSKKYYPIPITPEWLERLGFERVGDYYDLDFKGGGLRFVTDLEECRLFTGSEYSLTAAMDYDTCEIPNMPKYVHQIQNLYFVHAGTELPVKL